MDPQSTVTLHTGRAMPILGLGTWQLTKDTAGTVEAALRLGYRMIDTAEDYGTQPGIGEAIRQNATAREQSLWFAPPFRAAPKRLTAVRREAVRLAVAGTMFLAARLNQRGNLAGAAPKQ